MSVKDINIIIKNRLKGKYVKALSITNCIILLFFLIKAIEFLSLKILLNDNIENVLLIIHSISFSIIRFVILTPLTIAVFWWYVKITEKKYCIEDVDLFHILSDINILSKGYLLLLIINLINFMFIFVIAMLLFTSYYIFQIGILDLVLSLMVSANCILISLFVLYYYVNYLFSLSFLPVIFTLSNSLNPFNMLKIANKHIIGNRKKILNAIIINSIRFPFLPFNIPNIVGGICIQTNDILISQIR